MEQSRVLIDPRHRWGTPCIRDTAVTVGQVIALRKADYDHARIIGTYPELTEADVEAAIDWHERVGDEGLRPQPPDPGADHPRIRVDREIQGGYPCIAGTRVTVDAILGLWEHGFSVAQILDEYPGLTEEDVDAAIAYDFEVGL